MEAIRAIRRRELFRVAAGDLLGEIDVLSVGAALTDLASATIDATLAVAREASGSEPVPRIAVIAMGRWGGREMSYASDADAMFVMEDGADPDSDPTKVAGAVISEMRTVADPAARRPVAEHRCRPAAGGQGRRADPLADRVPELLQPLVLDLGDAGVGSRRRAGRRRGAG